MLISPGDIVLNKYRVERIVGKGGMGVVVAARHIDLDELFAIKFMLPAHAASREAAERFLREARAAAKLKGDHVARVQDVGRLPDGTSYMVMEYLTGSDLKEIVREQGPLPVGDAVRYVLQACETLREAHSLGIVHRDIKPANIFLARGPNGIPRVKVIDFGISKHSTGDAVGLTATSTVGGSPLYMSPEQMRSAKYVDGRTDVWAIGIVLYELLTGTTPFHADTITAVAGRVLQDEPLPPSRLRADVPPWIDSVIGRCLQKGPEYRYQTIDDLMRALRAPSSTTAVLEQSALDAPTIPLARAGFARVALDTAPLPDVREMPGIGTVQQLRTSSTTAGFGQVSNTDRPSRSGDHPPQRRGLLAGALLAAVALAVAAFLLLWARPPTGQNELMEPGAANSAPIGELGTSSDAPQLGSAAAASAPLSATVAAAPPEPSLTLSASPMTPPSPSASASKSPAKAAGTASAAISAPPMATATPVTTAKGAPVTTAAPSAKAIAAPTSKPTAAATSAPRHEPLD